MKVTIIGTGYVGLVTGACLAEMGIHVMCVDTDAERIRILESGGMPIHEPGLLEMVLDATANCNAPVPGNDCSGGTPRCFPPAFRA